MKVLNYTEVRQNLAKTLDAVVDDGEETVIHRTNDRSVVIISLSDWNAIKETEHLLSSPRNAERLRGAVADMNDNVPAVETSIEELEGLEAADESLASSRTA